MAMTWKEKFQSQLTLQYGQKKGAHLSKKYIDAFPAGYKDEYPTAIAIEDIKHLEKLSAQNNLSIHFYLTPEREYHLHLRLYQWQKPIPLSDILPTLENFDLRTYNERPHKVTIENDKQIWISDFAVVYDKTFNIDEVKALFQAAFINIYSGNAENDGFNKLVLGASLAWHDILILRAYAKYLHQIGFRFSQTYIEKALANHPTIAKQLVELFKLRNDPTLTDKARAKYSEIEEKIQLALESVTSLDEDRILCRLLDLINATQRTNYFQRDKNGERKKYLSIKLASAQIPELPKPIPTYETFVYAPYFEAIHLRSEKVARGGIRWSDRVEDFRTEILGLMKAQKVKNAVIVPSGAKGGFVLKNVTRQLTREELQAQVIHVYQSFIRGLLDITDNIKDGKSIRPEAVYCHDEFDPYLVVAADKGTSTFSDIANSIAKEYEFWLDDAFASGGSTGYDHKKMGITARGAWESIKRHFCELNVDVTRETITVIGIGDMSGDVFGNGMLYTNHIKLIAAFDHRHIFIDPTPDPGVAYQERKRLFNLPASSWDDYNKKLISKGGGVFSRALKSVKLTTEIKNALNVTDNTLPPNELICAILRAPVDLLFNGGIGTYVKASHENHAEVGDKTNDYCRVDGNELRCKVVGEGGNLGFTQQGRIEYALTGGLINTDFIDNSAGVDCSDHEVNLKILLNLEMSAGKLSQSKRNTLLASLTDEIAKLVLQDNYQQALVMSYSSFHTRPNMGLYTSYIKELEALGVFNRKIENIPDDKKLAERKAADEGLTRPELAVLLAYTKIHIKQEILKTDLTNDAYLSQLLETAFPAAIRIKYFPIMRKHRLHKEIIATQLSNHIVNQMGITFAYRLQMETGASIDEIIRAHAVAANIFGTHEVQQLIESLNFKLPMAEQYDMLFNIRQLINISTRWFLRSNRLKGSLESFIEHYRERIKKIEKIIPDLMAGHTKEYLDTLVERFLKAGLSREMATRIATYRAIYTSLNIVEVATKHEFDLIKTAKVYFAAGEHINLLWFRDQIANDTRGGHWNTLARLTLRDELDIAQRALTVAIMKQDKKEPDTKKLIQHWIDKNGRALLRWDKLLAMLHSSTDTDYTMFFITIRELTGLIES